MTQRKIGPFAVNPIGLGCMNLSHAYGQPPGAEEGARLLQRALDLGVDFFDTAALYGFGANESLLGQALRDQRHRFTLASKCGMTGVDGKRVIDGRPTTLRATCEAALQRLQTEVIDLYYLHRRDFTVPIEESVGALADLVAAGKIRCIGLSEVSAETIFKAHAVHPITAVQSEYSLWSREAEIGVIDACRAIGATFVAFSPLARGFLGGELRDPTTQLAAGDIRLAMPRFAPDNYARNFQLLAGYREIANEVGCSMAQLALAWILAKQPDMVVIPGTRSPAHLENNLGAARVQLTPATVARLDALINEKTVVGPRYNAATQKEIDTEQFAA
ncbi:MAG: aldo/keto reductase [Gammaproteobacteria bacterium]|nr:aldo/keto reductase [Gammaproteobacteria bacterium]MBU1600604.1 aldo/keto reductase [Gammaproteobacteria bacterium]MBU2435060.1 aldo/keto reductase [Gammaproteobacteria bacterium]MBU2448296.1 aldo/keto reductase [Gammaproteobacteria bacterium]